MASTTAPREPGPTAAATATTTTTITTTAPAVAAKKGAASATAAPVAKRKPSTRVKEMVGFDEKQHMDEIKKDIKTGVVHNALTELEERVNDLGESWESESLFEVALEDLTEDKFFDGMFFCFEKKAKKKTTTHGPEIPLSFRRVVW